MAYDLVKKADDLGAFRQSFCLSPAQWAQCSVQAQIQWRSVPFRKGERPNVPPSRGLYAFVIRPTVVALFEHGYLTIKSLT